MLTDGLEWCGLLWCFYQLFGLSFWRHPFTAEHPLLRQWCRDTFLQTWWRNKLILILDGLRVNIFSTFKCLAVINWNKILVTWWLYFLISEISLAFLLNNLWNRPKNQMKKNYKTRLWIVIVILLEKPVPEFPSNDPFGFWREALSEISLTREKTELDVSSGLWHMVYGCKCQCMSPVPLFWEFGPALLDEVIDQLRLWDSLLRLTVFLKGLDLTGREESLSDQSTLKCLQRRCRCDLPSGDFLLYPTPAPWMWSQLVCSAPEEPPVTVAQMENIYRHYNRKTHTSDWTH